MSRNNNALPTKIGAGIGFIAFLVFGAIPGLFYGGAMGLVMNAALFGVPVEPVVLTRVITGGGMVLGLGAALSLFLVVGAVVGTATGLAFKSILSPFTSTETEAVRQDIQEG